MSALKQEIKEAIREENGMLLSRIEGLTKVVEKLLQAQGDTVSIKGACDLLKCSDTTFWRYRSGPDKLIEPCGGTETRPVFYRTDVLNIREKLKGQSMGLKRAS
jgi:hypothetical protein